MELNEGILDRDGCRLHYWTGGNPTGPLVAFTHGATIDHREWDPTLDIVGENFRVLSWDVRGHGLSRPARFSLQDAVADLLAILDHLDVEEAIYVGHSMGGNLHQELVFRCPERVKAMVFLDCTWNFQKLSALETLSLRIAEPIFKIYPYKVLINQSLAVTATAKETQEFLRPAMESLSKDEYVRILMATSDWLHYEPGWLSNRQAIVADGRRKRHDRQYP